MMLPVIDTDTGFHLEFGRGDFDDYCVYVTKKGMSIPKLRDYDYFKWIKRLSKRYGVEVVYNDFKTVYLNVYYGVNGEVANKVIREVDEHYMESTQHWWGVFFMTMLAEEMKDKAVLGKMIKHLGVYNVLIDEWEISYVTSYMVGMKAQDLKWELIIRGIYKYGEISI